MAKKAVGVIDDALNRLVINDFAAGMNSYSSALSLKANETPACLNVIPFPGRFLYRGGWTSFCALTAAVDQIYGFYDSDGAQHIAVWSNGNLYDCVSGTASEIVASVYTAGVIVGSADDNGILYWSTQTVAIQYWNPVASTYGAVSKTGASDVPSSPYLKVIQGSLVAFGINYVPGTASDYQPNVFGWSAVGEFGDWDADNSQAVGPNNGGILAFGLEFGVAEIGVTPFRTIIVGRSDIGLYAYSGALGSLQEILISCPVGCADGASAQFAPSAEQFGSIIFLATDGQFWSTNGVTCGVISIIRDSEGNYRGVLPTLNAAFNAALATAGNRFWSGYNEQYQYYFCTVGSQQFVYKWDLKAWTLFEGWPVGPSINFANSSGVPQVWIGANTAVGGDYMVAQVGLPQTQDNGTTPNVYYKTPMLHMGDPKKYKEFHWISPQFYAVGAVYQIQGQSMARAADNSSMTMNPLLFTTPVGAAPGEFQLNVSQLNGPDVLGGSGSSTLVGTGNPCVSMARCVCPVNTQGTMLEGLDHLQETLKGCAAQFTISLYPESAVCDFELLGLEVLWLDRGYLRDGGNQYNPESGVPYGFANYPPKFDPYVIPDVQVVPTYNVEE